jgi:hypothetical protein
MRDCWQCHSTIAVYSALHIPIIEADDIGITGDLDELCTPPPVVGAAPGE